MARSKRKPSIATRVEQAGKAKPPRSAVVALTEALAEPTFADLIREHVTIALGACPTGVEPIEFLDAPDFEEWTEGHDALVIESVSNALGWLRGAHEALDITMREMFEEYDIEITANPNATER